MAKGLFYAALVDAVAVEITSAVRHENYRTRGPDAMSHRRASFPHERRSKFSFGLHVLP